MDYIDILHLNTYRAKYFTKRDKQITDNIFSYGEIGAITRKLKKRKLIKKDRWGRYVVQWREKKEGKHEKKSNP